jgi:hypothetical protein
MPLGPDMFNGPSGYNDNTVPPPPRPSSGTRVRFFEYSSFCVRIRFKHILLLKIQYFIYYIPAIKYELVTFHWFFYFVFLIFTLDFYALVWSMNME